MLKDFVAQGDVNTLTDEEWRAICAKLPQDLLTRSPCTEPRCEKTCNLGCLLKEVIAALHAETKAHYHETMKQINSEFCARVCVCVRV